MKYFSTPALFLLLLLAGCHTKPKEFTLSYIVESIGIYKFSIEIDKDKNYRIQQQNIFFDAIAKKEQINTSQGQMTDEEYDQLSKLIAGNRLFKMKDTYGFDQETDSDDPLNNLVYQLIYTEGEKTKYISIRSNPTDRYPEVFLQLIRFLGTYISAHSPND